ncbi:DUF5615 family PIN-like protein [Mucilaginibacter phyllosphaerae]|uniref:DUF5615 family PIN-like protein n=1 Tax=Mucilaginibacter phyllosphaerae TaxID=1812349 RepID=UPI0035A2380D
MLTFDEDFPDLQNIYFYQPKIIWLRTGNVATAEVAALLLKFEDRINNSWRITNPGSTKFIINQKSPALLQGFLLFNTSFTTF